MVSLFPVLLYLNGPSYYPEPQNILLSFLKVPRNTLLKAPLHIFCLRCLVVVSPSAGDRLNTYIQVLSVSSS